MSIAIQWILLAVAGIAAIGSWYEAERAEKAAHRAQQAADRAQRALHRIQGNK
ncbi:MULTISPECIES: hypothetical protein [unclassified Mycobacterium]|uniref:hypothetical protein n=1 Tax=unclassified Mycobacterium TaxID=2642494 RepID=UPI000AF06F08|nr:MULTISPECIES: hypothetical protein [unclassified Mycobacterium]